MDNEQKSSNALEALRKIKEAEEEARRMVQDAQDTQSVQIIQDAHEEAKQIRDKALEEARKNGQVRRAAVIQKAKAEAEGITRQAEQEKMALKKKTENQLEDAVGKVAVRIRGLISRGDQ